MQNPPVRELNTPNFPASRLHFPPQVPAHRRFRLLQWQSKAQALLNLPFQTDSLQSLHPARVLPHRYHSMHPVYPQGTIPDVETFLPVSSDAVLYGILPGTAFRNYAQYSLLSLHLSAVRLQSPAVSQKMRYRPRLHRHHGTPCHHAVHKNLWWDIRYSQAPTDVYRFLQSAPFPMPTTASFHFLPPTVLLLF